MIGDWLQADDQSIPCQLIKECFHQRDVFIWLQIELLANVPSKAATGAERDAINRLAGLSAYYGTGCRLETARIVSIKSPKFIQVIRYPSGQLTLVLFLQPARTDCPPLPHSIKHHVHNCRSLIHRDALQHTLPDCVVSAKFIESGVSNLEQLELLKIGLNDAAPAALQVFVQPVFHQIGEGLPYLLCHWRITTQLTIPGNVGEL